MAESVAKMKGKEAINRRRHGGEDSSTDSDEINIKYHDPRVQL